MVDEETNESLERILHEATLLFAEHGYHGVSTRALASGRPAIINVHTDPEQRSTAVAGLPRITE